MRRSTLLGQAALLARSGNIKNLYALGFDARFSLQQPGLKYLYMLDPPVVDNNFEVVLENGKRNLVTDKRASEILFKERDYVTDLKKTSTDQLKRVNKFLKFTKLVPVIKKHVKDGIDYE